MSDKPRFPNAVGMKVAAEICAALKPACDRLVVAGSLRRRRPTIGDVEILYIGKTEQRQDPGDMFGTVTVNFADEAIASLEASGVLERRKNSAGAYTYGPKNKLMLHRATGLPVDLFATIVDNWWTSLVIRTGSKEMNLKLTRGAKDLGRTLNAYGCGVTVLSTGEVHPARSEQEVFALCGVKYREPWQR